MVKNSITLCAELSAAAVVIGYWPGAADINVAAWISILLPFVLCLNIFAVRIYGEAEFIFASVKLVSRHKLPCLGSLDRSEAPTCSPQPEDAVTMHRTLGPLFTARQV